MMLPADYAADADACVAAMMLCLRAPRRCRASQRRADADFAAMLYAPARYAIFTLAAVYERHCRCFVGAVAAALPLILLRAISATPLPYAAVTMPENATRC